MTITNGSGAAATATEENGNLSDITNQLRNRRTAQLRTNDPTSSSNDREPRSPSNNRTGSASYSYRSSSGSFHDVPSSFRSSTGDLLSPRARDNSLEAQVETSLWHSLPLLLALLPALGGLAFKQGSVLFTDITLLGLTAIYLNWFLVTPWTWYHSARSVHLVQSLSSDDAIDDTMEDEEEQEEADEAGETPEKSEFKARKVAPKKKSTPRQTNEEKRIKSATQELQVQEIAALFLCFLGPIMGAYLLHIVRGYLSQTGHKLVSDLHLTLFVLGAELRPLRHAMKLLHARTLFLQRAVQQGPQSMEKIDLDVVRELSKRLDELEATATTGAVKSASEPAATQDYTEQFRKAHSTLQTQIDALNRAVRRYEKRATAQTMQTESRLLDLETRLREALSLAAVAASYSQKPGIIIALLEHTGTFLLLPLKVLRAATAYPVTMLYETTAVVMSRIGPRSGNYGPKPNSAAKYSRDGVGVRKYKG